MGIYDNIDIDNQLKRYKQKRKYLNKVNEANKKKTSNQTQRIKKRFLERNSTLKDIRLRYK